VILSIFYEAGEIPATAIAVRGIDERVAHDQLTNPVKHVIISAIPMIHRYYDHICQLTNLLT
jgi:hypothetical protein